MHHTLLKIGKQLLEGQSAWAQYTNEPKFDPNKKNWVSPILFDCVDEEVNLFKEEMQLFKKDDSSIAFRYIPNAIWGPRGKKCALTVEVKNFQMLKETLFGKKAGDKGSMLRSIEDYDTKLLDRPISKGLNEINKRLESKRSSLDIKKFKEEIDLGKEEEVVLFYTAIRSEKINKGKITPLFSLEGYEEFIIGNFYTPERGEKGLDYVTGKISDEIVETKFTGRYNIHKIFQTTASNYASGFSDFKKNFQSDPDTIGALDKASEYVLNNLQTQIAGIAHIIVPDFLSKDLDNFDIERTKLFLDKSSELLFHLNQLATATDQELPDIGTFWVNYFAYESDGNSFKILNHIKDVNSQYLQKVIEVFAKTGIKFRDYIGGKYTFNMQSIYYIVPIRDPNKRSKINPVLTLFKDILEQRVVSQEKLFHHFIELTLCYWYGRYASFPNISENDSFDFAIKDAVSKYSALIYALKQLNLIDMENQNSDERVLQLQTQYPNSQVNELLKLKSFNRNKIALFCMGRALNIIGYAQAQKNHSNKPILNKINFNGMNLEDLQNIFRALLEKGKQYQTVKTSKGNVFKVRKKVEEWLDLFNKYSDENNWSLSDEGAVFYLLTGYVFRPSYQNAEDNDDESIKDEIN